MAEYKGFIKDGDCSAHTSVVYGNPVQPIFGKGVKIVPGVPGKQISKYDRAIYLPSLPPLESFDLIGVLFSGGKDSLAAYLYLLELGVPKGKILLMHHDIDGRHATRRMDWPVTPAYVRSFAEAEQVALQISWRVDGFWGEVYRIGSSMPVRYESGDGEIVTCTLSERQIRSDQLREKIAAGLGAGDLSELMSYGYRMKFPAKTANLMSRWCSSVLKITVADSVIRNLGELVFYGDVGKFPAKGSILNGRWRSERLKANVADGVIRMVNKKSGNAEGIKILLISGERRGESSGRSRYNEIEIHRTNAEKVSRRTVYQWRPVIDWSEKDIWTIIRRHGVRAHPCYYAGWNRCSCMMCVFSLPSHWAGIKELFPKEYEAVRQDEIRLGFTLDNGKCLDEYVGSAKSCVNHSAALEIERLVTGYFSPNDVYIPPELWRYPAGAFHGAGGGSC